MDRVTEPVVGRFADDFGNSRVRMDRDGELFRSAFQQAGNSALGDHLGRMWTDDVQAEQVFGIGVGDDLGEAVRVSFDDCFGIRLHGELTDLDVVAALGRFLLREADTADLWFAIGAGRRVHLFIQRERVQPHDVFDCDDAMVHGGMGQKLLAIDITDSVDVGNLRLLHIVDRDVGVLCLDTELFEADVLDIALAADGDQQGLTLDHTLFALRVFDAHLDAVLADLDIVGCRSRTLYHGHFLSLEGTGELLGNVLVFHGDDVADQSGRSAVSMVNRGPLDAGSAPAADDEALRQLLQHDGMVGIDDLLAVIGNSLDRAGPRAGVDDDVFPREAERGAAVLRGDADGVIVDQLASANEHGNLVFLVEKIEEALVLPLDDLERPRERAIVIELDIALDIDAKFGRA